jgi:phosphoribosylformimino-5-aminoimidazole carboxamide ribotide isomerase
LKKHPIFESMKVIPAIDVLDGQVVRLHKGQYNEKTVYNESIVQQARMFKDAGFKHIHVVDLNGAREGRFRNLSRLSEIAQNLHLKVQTGGGVRSVNDISVLLDHGISQVISNSMAATDPKSWLKAIKTFGNACILGLDLIDGKIAYKGWEETREIDLKAFIAPMVDAGMDTILSTDISRDGTLSGPNFELYATLKSTFPELKIIASGGVADLGDIKELQSMSIDAVVVGKAYYEGRVSLEDLSIYAG